MMSDEDEDSSIYLNSWRPHIFKGIMEAELDVSVCLSQGGRDHMEDYIRIEHEPGAGHAFFGLFDGHGGSMAADFAQNHLLGNITENKKFSSAEDRLVLSAIREGFEKTQKAMWAQRPGWGLTQSGYPSTSGTTASTLILKAGKLFVGHVGDSAIVLGSEHAGEEGRWEARQLTTDHKPGNVEELTRIEAAGGMVFYRGVPRVVWDRPPPDHQGAIRRSTPIQSIPYLAVSRSLGDLWSYNPEQDVFIVSPEPQAFVEPLDPKTSRCIILGSDGLWDMMEPQEAVDLVLQVDQYNEAASHLLTAMSSGMSPDWVSPSEILVDRAMKRWEQQGRRPDNTSVITIMLTSPINLESSNLLNKDGSCEQWSMYRVPSNQ